MHVHTHAHTLTHTLSPSDRTFVSCCRAEQAAVTVAGTGRGGAAPPGSRWQVSVVHSKDSSPL